MTSSYGTIATFVMRTTQNGVPPVVVHDPVVPDIAQGDGPVLEFERHVRRAPFLAIAHQRGEFFVEGLVVTTPRWEKVPA